MDITVGMVHGRIGGEGACMDGTVWCMKGLGEEGACMDGTVGCMEREGGCLHRWYSMVHGRMGGGKGA